MQGYGKVQNPFNIVNVLCKSCEATVLDGSTPVVGAAGVIEAESSQRGKAVQLELARQIYIPIEIAFGIEL